MTKTQNRISRITWLAGAGVGAAALVGSAYAATTWLRYGHPSDSGESDSRLDRFMPEYEVADRYELPVDAPASVAYAALMEMDLQRSRLVRAIFRGRELLMRAAAPPRTPEPFLKELRAIGWGVLADDPGREIVFGAVTKPWEANPRFRAVPADEFTWFSEPGYAKIAFTLAVDSLGPDRSVVRTETRVATTDAASRARFRRYWTLLSPGILLIRRASLPLVKADAERRYRSGAR